MRSILILLFLVGCDGGDVDPGPVPHPSPPPSPRHDAGPEPDVGKTCNDDRIGGRCPLCNPLMCESGIWACDDGLVVCLAPVPA